MNVPPTTTTTLKNYSVTKYYNDKIRHINKFKYSDYNYNDKNHSISYKSPGINDDHLNLSPQELNAFFEARARATLNE
jgi:hypothetical protein